MIVISQLDALAFYASQVLGMDTIEFTGWNMPSPTLPATREWWDDVLDFVDVFGEDVEKPTWASLQPLMDSEVLLRLIDLTRGECRRRISDAYGASSWEDEMQKRLRGETGEGQDVERDRLRAVCKAQVAALRTMSHTQRLAYDPSVDTVWAPPVRDN